MTNYKINGHAVRVGDEWLDDEGARFEITGFIDGGCFLAKDRHHIVHTFNSQGRQIEVIEVERLLIRPVNAEPDTPDKPEDIAHLYEVNPNYEDIERKLLHAYRYETRVFLVYAWWATDDQAWVPTTVALFDDDASGPKPFRLREQWEPGFFIPSEGEKMADGSHKRDITYYERNTVTGEVRRVDG